MSILKTILMDLIGSKSKLTPSGWYSFNCPACVYNGEPSPDTRSRGGIKISFSDEIVFHCFRCQFKASWHPGRLLDERMKKLLKYLGLSKEDIQRLNFLIWKENNKIYGTKSEKFNHSLSDKKQHFFSFEEKKLPAGFKSLDFWLEKNIKDSNFFEVVKKLVEQRGINIFREVDFYWCPRYPYKNSILIPFIHENKIIGYAIRNFKSKNKYLIEKPKDYLFQFEYLFLPKRKYVILVEGVFDALAIKGVGILGNNLNGKQIDLINSSNKEIILLPDRDRGSRKLIEIALENKWKVSLPVGENCPLETKKEENKIINCCWDKDVKDASDAVRKYGVVFTLKSIIDSATDDPLKIKVLSSYFIQ